MRVTELIDGGCRARWGFGLRAELEMRAREVERGGRGKPDIVILDGV